MMKYCPVCAKEVKPLDEYPHVLHHCEECKRVYEETRVGFTTTGWKILGLK